MENEETQQLVEKVIVNKKDGRKKTSKKMECDSRKQKRPDMKLYVPPGAKHEDDKVGSHDDSGRILDSSHEESLDSSRESPNFTNGAGKQSSPEVADDEEPSWDTLFDDNGDCVKPELVNGFRETLNLKQNEEVRMEKTAIDYYQFQASAPEIDENEFSHVLEVYDFASDLKTQDIVTQLSVFNSRDFDIKWVDDTHALAVFASRSAAAEALKMPYHNMKLRRLSEAIRESKIKAKRCSEFLLPYKQRPETSAALARRLVTGALGLRVNITPEQRAEERKKLKEAREKKKLAIRQTQDVWEGNVS